MIQRSRLRRALASEPHHRHRGKGALTMWWVQRLLRALALSIISMLRRMIPGILERIVVGRTVMRTMVGTVATIAMIVPNGGEMDGRIDVDDSIEYYALQPASTQMFFAIFVHRYCILYSTEFQFVPRRTVTSKQVRANGGGCKR